MQQHTPDFPFGFRLPTDMAAQIRATTRTEDRPRPRRFAPMLWRFADRTVD